MRIWVLMPTCLSSAWEVQAFVLRLCTSQSRAFSGLFKLPNCETEAE